MTDWGALYREHVADVAAFAADLDDDTLARPVPGTPSWTVKDVVAHLAGGAADSVDGRMDDAPGPAWTSRHVAERRHLPVAALVDELRANQDAVAGAAAEARTPAIVWDIAVHHADLHEAFGKPRLAEHLWRPVADVLGPMRAPELVDTVPPYELFRLLFSRRSRAQVRALDPGLSEERIAEIPIFGARDDDQPVSA
jgi:uncharacterized protein (TIGR03083 family)